MAGWEDVRAVALVLPESSERRSRELYQWRVRDKLFAWERPLRPREIAELGADAPDGPILAARVEHVLAKEALLANDPHVFFSTSHFEGYPAILTRLERIGLRDLEELITEAWLCRAPAALVEDYLERRR